MSPIARPKARAQGHHEKQAGSGKKASGGIPFIVVILALLMGFTGYFVAYFLPEHHTMHLPGAAAGLLLGILIGYIWYFTRGDAGLF